MLMIVVLQFQLWVGDDSVSGLHRIAGDLARQQEDNESLAQRNRRLEIDVLDLKNGYEAVEERARQELGMIAAGETFYLIVD